MIRRVLLTIFATATVFSLSACGGVSLSGRPVCPPLAPWTDLEAQLLADEIESDGWRLPYMTRAARELRVLRKQCRPREE